MPAAELAARWRAGWHGGSVLVEADSAAALDRASRAPAAEAGPVVVAGSLYLVGAARALLVDDPDLRDPSRPRTHDRRSPRHAPRTRRRPRIGPTTFRWGERTLRDGDHQRHARFVLGRRRARAWPRGTHSPGSRAIRSSWRSRGRAGWSPTAPTSSTSAANPLGPAIGRSPPTRRPAASCRSIGALRAALPEHPAQRRHDQGVGRGGGPRRRRGPDQRCLGRRPGRRPAAPGRGDRACRSSSCTTAPSRATTTSSPRSIADLRAALDRAGRLGVPLGAPDRRPGLRLRQDARAEPGAAARARRSSGALGRPILLGTSRKSTLGRVLDLGPEERLEATLATTALGDRGRRRPRPRPRRPRQRPRGPDQRCDHSSELAGRVRRRRPQLSDRIILANMQFQGRHGVLRPRAADPPAVRGRRRAATQPPAGRRR